MIFVLPDFALKKRKLKQPEKNCSPFSMIGDFFKRLNLVIEVFQSLYKT